jgi:hypothetical protein
MDRRTNDFISLLQCAKAKGEILGPARRGSQ